MLLLSPRILPVLPSHLSLHTCWWCWWWQVTTLLSKVKELEATPGPSPAELEALRAGVVAQGEAVKAAKAVSGEHTSAG